MKHDDRVDAVNPQEPEISATPDKTLTTPNFDENSIHHARPAVPLAHGATRTRNGGRAWSLPLVALAIAAGIIGGIVGIFALSLYERRATQQPAAPVSTSATNATRADAQNTPAQSSHTTPDNAASAQTSTTTSGSVVVAPQTDRVVVNAGTATNVSARGDAQAGALEGQQQRGASDDEARDLRASLDEWITATNARDIERQMKFYEPTVAAYYLTRNVSRQAVRAEKESVFARASAVDVRADEPQISVTPDGRAATMRFRKQYAIEGGGQDRRGAVIQELRWRRTPQGWRITSERDLRIVN
jgi:ketosteroid isomerase-like protein